MLGDRSIYPLHFSYQPMKTLFISDLHLDPQRSDIQDCFNQFINSCLLDADNIDALYILGDLFEVWIGDDASVPLYQQAIEQLKQLSSIGIKLFVMHGNRDFLLGAEFAEKTGSILIPDPYIITLKHEKILLSHGDCFCTDDKDYMQFRKQVRNTNWQTNFLAKTIDERVDIATAMREASQLKGQQEQQYQITDVNQADIEDIMLEHDVKTMIHGHTHRPKTHQFKIKEQQYKRIVLPDWVPGAEPLCI